MEKTVMISHHADDQSKSTTLITERLEQLGYQCFTDSCEEFTTLRLTPIESKNNEEATTPPSESIG
jgi:hypothetical protein